MPKGKKQKNGNAKAKAAALPIIDHPVYNEHGQAVYMEESKVAFNQTSLVRKFVMDQHVGMERTKETMLKYSPTTGAWEPLTSSKIGRAHV